MNNFRNKDNDEDYGCRDDCWEVYSFYLFYLLACVCFVIWLVVVWAGLVAST